MARYIAQVFVLGAQVIARAFSRALEQEIAASRAAAQRSGSKNTKATAYTSAKLGMTVPEAKQILNVDSLDPAEIEKKYNHLFEVNDRSRGGSFYLQSKVVRAKERLEEEIKLKNEGTANDSQKKDEMS